MKLLRTLVNRESPPSIRKGKYFEKKAQQYLKKQGLKDFQLNFHSRFGEIDLIARDADTLVFIEVRYRKNEDHGSAAASVNFYKQKKIIRTAEYFMQKSGLTNKIACRFDVIGITGNTTGDLTSGPSSSNNKETLKIVWIKNAF